MSLHIRTAPGFQLAVEGAPLDRWPLINNVYKVVRLTEESPAPPLRTLSLVLPWMAVALLAAAAAGRYLYANPSFTISHGESEFGKIACTI